MITQYFLDLPYYIVASFINFFPPSVGFPPDVLQSAELIGGQIGMFDPVMPVADLSAALGILFSAQIGIWVYKSSKAILAHIPFIGGKG